MSAIQAPPLLIRPGARFRCFGDGLCCTDIHAIGPLNAEDEEFLLTISEQAVESLRGATDARVLMMRQDTGCCIFLDSDGCALHRDLGADLKPSPCIRFPFGLTLTPQGGRLTTQHCCPCRTVGASPAIDPLDVLPALIEGDSVCVDHEVGDQVGWSAGEMLSFDAYAAREGDLLVRIVAGDGIARALGQDPFPALEGGTWEQVAEAMCEAEGGNRLEVALQWFGDALLSVLKREPARKRQRPWSDAFERAASRARPDRVANDVFGDWLADEIWGLRWTAHGPFLRAASELATKLVVARRLHDWLGPIQPNDELAAAEAVTIVEVVSGSDWWEALQARIVS